MTDYVVGFLFSEDRRQVILINKMHPEWQAGLLNGVGGKVEQGETPEEAMEREFLEETGMPAVGWQQVALLRCPNCLVYFFRGFGIIENIKQGHQSPTDEQVCVMGLDAFQLYFRNKAVQPVSWMIQMCLDDDIRFPVIIEY